MTDNTESKLEVTIIEHNNQRFALVNCDGKPVQLDAHSAAIPIVTLSAGSRAGAACAHRYVVDVPVDLKTTEQAQFVRAVVNQLDAVDKVAV